jgi:PDDEXK-like domain of unknown function (DUF3799)
MTEQTAAAVIDAQPLPKHLIGKLTISGVYLGMPENEYHASPALGSTDMKFLATRPSAFWFESRFNPDWEPEEDTPSRKFGRAAHCAVLEPDEFRKRYVGVQNPGNTKAGKMEREDADEEGKTWLPFDTFRRAALIGAMVRNNKVLANAFDGGAASEVSIFWTSKSGIAKKCRIDYLKVRASVDLKTIANQFQENFPVACRKAISNYRYDIQCQHYIEGRQQLAGFVKAGRVFGTGKPITDLFRLAAESTSWASVIVFAQSQGAPETFGVSLSPGNGILDFAQRSIEQAEHNWNTYCAKFGLETPWVLEEPLEELSIDDMPGWFGR